MPDARGPRGVARGDDRVAGAGLGHPGQHRVLVLGVVEDQQAGGAALGLVELLTDPPGLGLVVEVEALEVGEQDEPTVHPEHLGIAAPELLGVLAGEGGLADAAERGDGLDAALGERGGGGAEELLVQLVELRLAADEMRVGREAQVGDPFGLVRRRAGEQLADGHEESLPGGVIVAGEVEGLVLEAPEGRGGHVLPASLDDERDRGLGAVGLEPRPLRELPPRGEHRQDDTARLAALLDLTVPVAAGAQPRLVEPHAEARGDEPPMQRLGERQVGRGVADEAVEGHRNATSLAIGCWAGDSSTAALTHQAHPPRRGALSMAPDSRMRAQGSLVLARAAGPEDLVPLSLAACPSSWTAAAEDCDAVARRIRNRGVSHNASSPTIPGQARDGRRRSRGGAGPLDPVLRETGNRSPAT